MAFGHVTNTHKGTTGVGTQPPWPAAVCGLTLHSLLQHGEAVGNLGLQLVDLECSADGQTRGRGGQRGEQLTVSFTEEFLFANRKMNGCHNPKLVRF